LCHNNTKIVKRLKDYVENDNIANKNKQKAKKEKIYKSCTPTLNCSKLFKIQNENKDKNNQIK
jgi:nucleoid-associated protein YejK